MDASITGRYHRQNCRGRIVFYCLHYKSIQVCCPTIVNPCFFSSIGVLAKIKVFLRCASCCLPILEVAYFFRPPAPDPAPVLAELLDLAAFSAVSAADCPRAANPLEDMSLPPLALCTGGCQFHAKRIAKLFLGSYLAALDIRRIFLSHFVLRHLDVVCS